MNQKDGLWGSVEVTLLPWNPRYLAYCRSEYPGLTPEETMEADRGRWSGGHMAGFIIWIGERWREWLIDNPDAIPKFLSDKDHANFDLWLLERHP